MAIIYSTEKELESLIKEDFVIVDFFSTTCGPCKLFSKVLDVIEGELPFVNIAKMNITDYPEIAKEYKITSVPTVHFYKAGKLMEAHLGVMRPDAVKEAISKYMY